MNNNRIAGSYSLYFCYLLPVCLGLFAYHVTYINGEVMGNLKLLLEAAAAAPVKAVEEVEVQHRNSQPKVEEVLVQVLVQHRNSQPMML